MEAISRAVEMILLVFYMRVYIVGVSNLCCLLFNLQFIIAHQSPRDALHLTFIMVTILVAVGHPQGVTGLGTEKC